MRLSDFLFYGFLNVMLGLITYFCITHVYIAPIIVIGNLAAALFCWAVLHSLFLNEIRSSWND